MLSVSSDVIFLFVLGALGRGGACSFGISLSIGARDILAAKFAAGSLMSSVVVFCRLQTIIIIER